MWIYFRIVSFEHAHRYNGICCGLLYHPMRKAAGKRDMVTEIDGTYSTGLLQLGQGVTDIVYLHACEEWLYPGDKLTLQGPMESI